MGCGRRSASDRSAPVCRPAAATHRSARRGDRGRGRRDALALRRLAGRRRRCARHGDERQHRRPQGCRADPRRRRRQRVRHVSLPGGRSIARPLAVLPAALARRRALGGVPRAAHGYPARGARGLRCRGGHRRRSPGCDARVLRAHRHGAHRHVTVPQDPGRRLSNPSGPTRQRSRDVRDDRDGQRCRLRPHPARRRRDPDCRRGDPAPMPDAPPLLSRRKRSSYRGRLVPHRGCRGLWAT